MRQQNQSHPNHNNSNNKVLSRNGCGYFFFVILPVTGSVWVWIRILIILYAKELASWEHTWNKKKNFILLVDAYETSLIYGINKRKIVYVHLLLSTLTQIIIKSV